MFRQFLTPVAGSLTLSALAAAIPIAIVLVLLGIARRPAWQASLAGLAAALILSAGLWHFPIVLALDATAAGAVFALWPIMWIVFNALLLFNIAVETGRFTDFRDWMLHHLPNDRRVILIVVGFCFGALLEGVAGFGTPIAITSALLIMLGFPTLEALTYTLIFNTAPVAFGALGAPVTTLGAVTHLPDTVLGAMIGRQLPFLAFLLPFYVLAIYGGARSLKALWPLAAVAGGSFALTQFICSNFISYILTDVLSSLMALIVTVTFLKFWRPPSDPLHIVARHPRLGAPVSSEALWRGWVPWVLVSAVVIVWTVLKVSAIGAHKIPWPGLDKAVFITLYNQPYAAVWAFQPLASGTAILTAAILTAIVTGAGAKTFVRCIALSWRQSRIAILTVALILGLAYLMNYSGMTYTLGLAVASAGIFFPLLSAFLGWVAVFLSGSDTSGNALFGNLQVVAAGQLHLNPILMAATNSSGGVLGKMISPQNISTGVATTELKGKEGVVVARTFKHSVFLTLILGLIVILQQYVVPWMIPH